MHVGRNGHPKASIELLGLEQAGELLREARLGQGQHLAGLPEDVCVGRRRCGDVRNGGTVPQFDRMEGPRRRAASLTGAVTAAAVLVAPTNGTTAPTGTRTDAHQGSLEIGRQYAVDRQRRIHEINRLVAYGKV
jgi:hypothetical protein